MPKLRWCGAFTCAEREAGLLAHVPQAHRDAVSSSRLQTFQLILHRVVLGGQFVIPLLLTDHIAHVDRIRLQNGQRTQQMETKKQVKNKIIYQKPGGSEVLFVCYHQECVTVSYQGRVWGVIRRLPLQCSLCFVHSDSMKVSWRKPLIGDHFDHGVVRWRTQEGGDNTHLQAERQGYSQRHDLTEKEAAY